MSIVHFIDIVLKNVKGLIIVVLLSMTTMAFFSIVFMDKWYQSTATVVQPSEGLSSLSALVGKTELGSGLLGIGSTPGSQRYIAILNSRRLREDLIKSYDLINQFGVDSLDDMMEILEDNMLIDSDRKLGTISISLRHPKDAQLTAEMTNYAVQQLDRINREMSTEQARSTRIFIEERYNRALADLSSAEDSLNVFRKQFGIIELGEQTKVSIESMAGVLAKIEEANVEKDVLLKTAGPNHPEYLQLETKVEALRKLERKLFNGSPEIDLIIPFEKSPEITLKYVRLYRSVEICQRIVEFLVPQYEQAKIQEAKDTPTLLILDSARAADHSYKPRKTILVLLTGFIVALLWVGTLYFIDNIKSRLTSGNDPELLAILERLKLVRFLHLTNTEEKG
ncbi:MAG: hypothetical protein KDC99_18010 [Cyclobacteriaceae bacterium]|nr:hypothetical protein [Cyclobacteriaceae bacterium]